MAQWFAAVGLVPGMTPAQVEERVALLCGPDGDADRRAVLAALGLIDGQFNAHGVEMGQRYTSTAVVPDGRVTAPTRDPELHYQPTTDPGCPLPHVWLTRDEHEISTLDVCGYDRFTLLIGASGAPWVDAAIEIGREFGVDVEPVIVSLGHETNDAYGDWTRCRDVDDTGALLVRPDRIVAWRSSTLPDDPTGRLRIVISQILDCSPAADLGEPTAHHS